MAAKDGEEILTAKDKAGKAGKIYSGILNNLGDILDSLPADVDLSQSGHFPAIGDQGYEGSCASFATTYYAATYETAAKRDISLNDYPGRILSPKFAYNLNNDGSDDGTSLEGNIYMLATRGTPFTDEASMQNYQYNGYDFISGTTVNPLQYLEYPQTADIYNDAFKNRIWDFGTVEDADTPDGLATIKGMLNNGHVLVFGTEYMYDWKTDKPVGDDLAATADDGFAGQVACYGMDESHPSGHALTVVGYNDDIWVDIDGDTQVDSFEKGALKIANSWGVEWGNGGYIWLCYNALHNWGAYTGVIDYNELIYILAQDEYVPKVTAELTVTTARRDEMWLSMGANRSEAAQPLDGGYYDYVFSGDWGGPYSFAGTTSASTATLVVDLTDSITDGGFNAEPGMLSFCAGVEDSWGNSYVQRVDAVRFRANGAYTQALGTMPVSVNGTYAPKWFCGKVNLNGGEAPAYDEMADDLQAITAGTGIPGFSSGPEDIMRYRFVPAQSGIYTINASASDDIGATVLNGAMDELYAGYGGFTAPLYEGKTYVLCSWYEGMDPSGALNTKIALQTAWPASSASSRLSSLALSGGGLLIPTFSPGAFAYNAQVNGDFTMSATPEDSGAYVVCAGKADLSSTVPMEPDSAKKLRVEVTSKDWINTDVYTILASRGTPSSDASLSSLTVSPSTIAPAFSAGTTEYTVTLPDGDGSATINAIPANVHATVYIDGAKRASMALTLAGGSCRDVSVRVVAQDLVSSKTYTLHLRRAGTFAPGLLTIAIAPQTSPPYTPMDTAMAPDSDTLYIMDTVGRKLYAADMDAGRLLSLLLPYAPVKISYAGDALLVAMTKPAANLDAVAIVDPETFTITKVVDVSMDIISGLAGDSGYIYTFNATRLDAYNRVSGSLTSSLSASSLSSIRVKPANGLIYARQGGTAPSMVSFSCAGGVLAPVGKNLQYSGAITAFLPDGSGLLLDSGVILSCGADASTDLQYLSTTQKCYVACVSAGTGELYLSDERLINVYGASDRTFRRVISEPQFVKYLMCPGRKLVTGSSGASNIYTFRETDLGAALKLLKVNGEAFSEFYPLLASADAGEVPNACASAVVEAVPANTVAEVTGDVGTVPLAVGANTLHITVTAPGGGSRTYAVTVTRRASDPPARSAFTDLGFTPLDSVLDPARSALYLTAVGGKSLYRADLVTGEVTEKKFSLTTERLAVKNGKIYVTMLRSGHWYSDGTYYNGYGAVAVVDAATFKTESVFNVNIDPYDIEVDEAGVVYLAPGSNQHSILATYDSANGRLLSSYSGVYYQSYIDRNPVSGKIYLVTPAVSPVDLFAYETAGGKVTMGYDSPYHGDYAMSALIRVTPDGQHVFNGAGDSYACAPTRTGDMLYEGHFGSVFTSACFDMPNDTFYTAQGKTLNIYTYSSRALKASHEIVDSINGLYYDGSRVILLQQTGGGANYLRFLGEYSTEADLSLIQTSAGTLSPSFDPNRMSYALSLGISDVSAVVTPVPFDNSAVVKIDGAAATSKTFNLANGASAMMTIEVTSRDGFKRRTYWVYAYRQASSQVKLSDTGFFSPLNCVAGPEGAVFMTKAGQPIVYRVDLAGGAVSAIPVPGTAEYLTYAGGMLYVTIYESVGPRYSIGVIDPVSLALIDTFTVGERFKGLRGDADYLYAYNDNGIAIYARFGGQKLAYKSYGYVYDLQRNPVNGLIYIYTAGGMQSFCFAGGQITNVKYYSGGTDSGIVILPDGKHLVTRNGTVMTCDAVAANDLIYVTKLPYVTAVAADVVANELYAVNQRLIYVYDATSLAFKRVMPETASVSYLLSTGGHLDAITKDNLNPAQVRSAHPAAVLQSLKIDREPFSEFYPMHFAIDRGEVPFAKASVDISAVPAQAGAVVSGDTGVQPLSVGDNTLHVTVTVPGSGTSETYSIHFSRRASDPPPVTYNALMNIGFTPKDTALDPDRNVEYMTAAVDTAKGIDGKSLYRVDLSTGNITEKKFDLVAERLAVKNGKIYVTLLRSGHNFSDPYGADGYGAVAIVDIAAFRTDFIFNTNIDPFDIEADETGNVYLAPGSDQGSILASYKSGTGQYLSGASNMCMSSYIDRNLVTGKIYSVDTAVSPRDLYGYEVANGVFGNHYDSPYHGEYALSDLMKVSPDGSRIFNGSGNMFACMPTQGGDMGYLGTLSRTFTSICFDVPHNRFYLASNTSKTLAIYAYGTRTTVNNLTLPDNLQDIQFCGGRIAALMKKTNGDCYVQQYTPDTFISGITVAGASVPGFNPFTREYSLTVSATTGSIAISASALDPNGNVSGSIGTQCVAFGENTYTITVTGASGLTDSYLLHVTRPPLHVTGVTLNESAIGLYVGQSHMLTATVQPLGATEPSVTWSSDEEGVASVDNTGKVTATAVGSATVTVTTADGGFTDSCTVNVTIPVTGVSLDRHAADLEIGAGMTLVATVTPVDASETRVYWSSSDASVASVDGSGHVTTHDAGTATIAATTVDGGFTDECVITVPRHATGISLDKKTESLSVGSSTILVPTVSPADATNKNVTWSSDDSDVATVNGSGRVTAVARGTVTITVTTVDGGFTESCAVTVTEPVTGVRLDRHATDLEIGAGFTLVATVTPEDASDTSVTWSSSNETVTTVNSLGRVTAVDAGTATITVTTKDGGFTDECVITVLRHASSVCLDRDTASLHVGDSITLVATVSPADTTNKSVTWSSDNTEVATVDSTGHVTAVAKGTAAITVTTVDGGFTDSCSMTVTKPVAGVSLDHYAADLEIGAELTLVATVTPLDASETRANWSSSNTSVASVDGFGRVTAHDAGSVTITVTTVDGGFTDECAITVLRLASGVSLDRKTASLPVGGSIILMAAVSPADATNKNITWSSNDTDVAIVNGSGRVTAVAKGSTTISATTVDGGYTDSCAVTVTEPVTGVSLDKHAAELGIGYSMTLAATVTPEDASDTSVTWSSSDESVATVNCLGRVTAVEVGTATITVTTIDGGFTDECVITVPRCVTGVSLDRKTASMLVLSSMNLVATVSPADAANKSVTWESDNTNVATVSSTGKVTSVGKGTANISVTSVDGGFTDCCAVTVIEPVLGVSLDKQAVTLDIGSGITLTATVYPEAASDKSVSWSSSSESVALIDSYGHVTAVNVGAATITVKTVDGAFTDSCVVTVVRHATGVELDSATAALFVGESRTLAATVSPTDASNKNVTWSSSIPSVATVNNIGKVMALANGNTVITVTTQDGSFSDSCAVTVTTLLAPAQPKAVSASYNSITVSWTAAIDASGYEVWRVASSTGTYTYAGTTTGTSFTNTGLTTNAVYYFKVRSNKDVTPRLFSGWSTVVSARPMPSAPATIDATSASYSSIRVSWGPVAGATGYQVYRSTSSTGTYALLTTTTTASYVNTGLVTGTAYYYKVRAYHLEGTTKVYGPFSAYGYDRPTLGLPVVKTTQASYNSVKVTWGAVAGASGYEIYRHTSADSTDRLLVSTTALAYTNASLLTGTEYTYKVRAYQLIGTRKVYGAFSPVSSCTPMLSAPLSVTALEVSDTSNKISWGVVAGAAKYEVWSLGSNGSEDVLLAETAGLYYINPGTTAGETYSYKVRAYRLVSTTKVYSGFSLSRWTFMPSSVQAVSSLYNGITISWVAVRVAAGYEVYRATSSTGMYSLITTTTQTSYANTGLTTGAAYYYKVRAFKLVDSAKIYGDFTTAISARPVPSVPVIDASSASYTSVRITWGAVAGASRYEIYCAASSTGTYTLLTATTATAYLNTGLVTGTAYYYKVRAYHLEGTTKVYGPSSTYDGARPALGVPSIKAVQATSSSIKITWGGVTGASGYEIYRHTSADSTDRLLVTTTALTYTNISLSTGTTYSYLVRAYRLIGTRKVYGAFSAVSSCTLI